MKPLPQFKVRNILPFAVYKRNTPEQELVLASDQYILSKIWCSGRDNASSRVRDLATVLDKFGYRSEDGLDYVSSITCFTRPHSVDEVEYLIGENIYQVAILRGYIEPVEYIPVAWDGLNNPVSGEPVSIHDLIVESRVPFI